MIENKKLILQKASHIAKKFPKKKTIKVCSELKENVKKRMRELEKSVPDQFFQL